MAGSHDQHDAFTRGYIEALFFTKNGGRTFAAGRTGNPPDFDHGDLAPKALAMITSDCLQFQASPAFQAISNAPGFDAELDYPIAGRDFWLTRNGHEQRGFWDGDWPEPNATALTATARAFGEIDAFVGDDGRVWLSPGRRR